MFILSGLDLTTLIIMTQYNFMFLFPGLDLTTLIIPLLALVGLFLLFPTYVTLTSVRYSHALIMILILIHNHHDLQEEA